MKTLISLLLLASLVACSNNEQKFDCEGIGLVLTPKGAKIANNNNLVYCKTEGVWNYYGTGDCKNLDKDSFIFDTITYVIHAGNKFTQCKKVN